MDPHHSLISTSSLLQLAQLSSEQGKKSFIIKNLTSITGAFENHFFDTFRCPSCRQGTTAHCSSVEMMSGHKECSFWHQLWPSGPLCVCHSLSFSNFHSAYVAYTPQTINQNILNLSEEMQEKVFSCVFIPFWTQGLQMQRE